MYKMYLFMRATVQENAVWPSQCRTYHNYVGLGEDYECLKYMCEIQLTEPKFQFMSNHYEVVSFFGFLFNADGVTEVIPVSAIEINFRIHFALTGREESSQQQVTSERDSWRALNKAELHRKALVDVEKICESLVPYNLTSRGTRGEDSLSPAPSILSPKHCPECCSSKVRSLVRPGQLQSLWL